EIALHGRTRREIARHGTPLATRRQDVEQGVDHIAKPRRARTTPPRGGRQRWGNDRPFAIRHIACITGQFPRMLPAGDLGPNHRMIPSSLATSRNHTKPGSPTNFGPDSEVRARKTACKFAMSFRGRASKDAQYKKGPDRSGPLRIRLGRACDQRRPETDSAPGPATASARKPPAIAKFWKKLLNSFMSARWVWPSSAEPIEKAARA